MYNSIGRKLLFSLNAETAHGVSINALKTGFHPRFDGAADPRLGVEIAGLNFPNPLGMAAGYDKAADVPDALLAMGFGHTEVGTITPLPQPGNPKPRIFRLVEDGAVINRLGFNSTGHKAAKAKLQARSNKNGLVGVNIGANKVSEDFGADYVAGVHAFAKLASYFTVNISSPNTPGLRALQEADPLADLLKRVSQAREENQAGHVPLFLKIAPDLSDREMDAIASALQQSDFNALIVSNTTLSRENLTSPHKDEVGGLSGKPLFEPSTIVLAKMYQRLGKDFPLVGVGGVDSFETALAKIEAGASLVQLYSGLIYQGPGLPGDILKGFSQWMDRENIGSISDVVGRKCDEWANKT